MRIPNNIVTELHNLNCEDVAQRFGLNPKGHKCRCFKHDDRIASLGFRQNHWKCFSCDVGGDAIALAQEYFSVSYGHENEASTGLNDGRSCNVLISSEMGGARGGRGEKTKRAIT